MLRGQAPPLCKIAGCEEGSAIVWRRSAGVQKGPWHSQGERTHRRAGESCVDSKAVGLHGLVLTDKASLNGQPLRRRSTTLSFKTCAGIATSAACALVLMFRAVSETRHAAWLLFCWLAAGSVPRHVRSSCCVRPAPGVLQRPWLNMSFGGSMMAL